MLCGQLAELRVRLALDRVGARLRGGGLLVPALLGSLTVDIFVDGRSECTTPGLCPGVAAVKMRRSGSRDLLDLTASAKRQQATRDAPDEHDRDQHESGRPGLLLRVRVGLLEYEKITIGIDAIAWLGSVLTVVPTKIDVVNSSGGVPPAARATATIVAVTIPPTAVGRITVSTVRAGSLPAPSHPRAGATAPGEAPPRRHARRAAASRSRGPASRRTQTGPDRRPPARR